jgi:hypothetical protein
MAHGKRDGGGIWVGLVVTLDGDDAADELRALRAWLVEEDELRGCVQTRENPPAAGYHGPVLDALEIVAVPAAGVLSAAIVAWLKTRVGKVRLVVTASEARRSRWRPRMSVVSIQLG